MKTQGVLVLLLVVTGLSEQQCPRSWTQRDESCYVVLDRVVTWLSAREFCEAVGGHLVEVESADENNFLLNMLKTHGVTGAWIGLEDIIEEGRFVWTTSQKEASFTNWSTGEPDDLQGQDCVWMTNTSPFTPGAWDDADCASYQVHAVCEQSIQG
ncbi:low affinity immunoglobulin epsilon Fc receptor-like [Pomacea canaliculata]|uniref:low affinity immunoglobulin epsilon Fc receptor-like n=1 Tax=Pomacea canaliculata TaxID=400727 RepID=UPI000D73EE21|nr:low affinity immunoglobulin epsilon Fc receptor-like [Pomacea canaliculata]